MYRFHIEKVSIRPLSFFIVIQVFTGKVTRKLPHSYQMQAPVKQLFIDHTNDIFKPAA